MAEQPAAASGGGRGGGRGRGKGRGKGRGGRGRGKGGGNKEKAAASEDNKANKNETANTSNNEPQQQQQQQANSKQQQQQGNKAGRGEGGRGEGGNKNRRRRNNNNKGGKGGGNKGGGKNNKDSSKEPTAAAPAPPPPKSEEQKQREEDEKKQREEAEALRIRQEEEQKAIEAAREKRRKEREALEQCVKESIDALKAQIEVVEHHKANRVQLQADALADFRKKFVANKKSLKTDLKKCTAFVKKVKSGAAWAMKPDEINRDVSTLNLSRYVDEVVAALLDAKLKLVDLPVVVALSISMHMRYEDFLPNLLPGLWAVINEKATEETAKNRRLYVRLITDFVLNGLVTEANQKQLVKLISEATGGKDGSYAVTDANLIVAFGKAAGYEIFGRRPRSVRIHATKVREETQKAKKAANTGTSAEGAAEATTAQAIEAGPVVIPIELADKGLEMLAKLEETMTELAVPTETSEAFAKHCLGAYQTLSNSLVATHVKLLKLEKRCEQDRLLSGTLPEAREKGLADARKLLESLQKSVDTFSDVLDQPLPQLEQEENDGEADAGGGGLELWTKGGGDGESGTDFGPFDDEETRAFYCDIPDLLTTVPPGLLGISPEEIERRKAENLQKYGSGFDAGAGAVDDEADAAAEEGLAEEHLVDDEDAAATVDGEPGAEDGGGEENTQHYKLTVLLEQELPECNRREQIDELAEKFVQNNGSSKNSRKRLSKTLFLVPRTRLDLLPYYSRMAAILDRVWPDIAPPLVKELEQQFHGQTKYKKQSVESRFKTARYIGELTKFRVAPPIVALRCIKRCCDDFSGANIDVCVCLLECCGRYLYRIKHTNARLTQLLDTITRLSKAAHLDERHQSLIKAAFYTVKPPPSGPRKQAKEYSPLEAYLRHLLLERLEPDANSVSFVSKQIIRFPWNDPTKQCGPLVCKIILKTCRKGRYKGIQALAAVAANLRRHRPEVSVRLIDAVIEELRWAVEHPNFRDQQRIISYARLLGELFVSSLVSGQLIIQQLYLFLNVGHEIPLGLREASEKHREVMAAGASTAETNKQQQEQQLPVYNSAGGEVTAINEDEELDEAPLETKEEEEVKPQDPVAVSKYSEFDPRVPSPEDPPNSAFRVKLVCTLLEVVAKNLVTRSNIPKLQGFMAAFQRYLFTKTSLPTEVEFSLLDTFDIVDSTWRKATKDGGKGSKGKKEDGDGKEEVGFPRYANWLEAHNATVAAEEADYLAEARTRARIEAMAGESTAENLDPIEGDLLHEDEESDEEDVDDDDSSAEDPMSLSAKDSVNDDNAFEMESGDEEEDGEEHMELSHYDEQTTDDDSDDSNDSDGETDDEEGSEEEEFDEQAYLAQMEEEAFERELRRVTMEALEKGKATARTATGGKVADTMISGSMAIIKKKPAEASKAADPGGPTLALGGGAGISFQLLKKGNKGKVEAKEIVVPTNTNLAKAATKQDDEAARERDMIKARVLQYEADSAEARGAGGNIYLEQEKLQVIRNRPLSMEEIDRNFGTSGGNLRPGSGDRNRQSPSAAGRSGSSSMGGRGGRGGRGRGRGNASGRILF